MLKGSNTEITGLAGGTVEHTNRKGSSRLKVVLIWPRLNSLLVVLVSCLNYRIVNHTTCNHAKFYNPPIILTLRQSSVY